MAAPDARAGRCGLGARDPADVVAGDVGGRLGAGDPLQKVVQLIAPLMVEKLWRRMEVGAAPPAFDPDLVAEQFLRGHGS